MPGQRALHDGRRARLGRPDVHPDLGRHAGSLLKVTPEGGPIIEMLITRVLLVELGQSRVCSRDDVVDSHISTIRKLEPALGTPLNMHIPRYTRVHVTCDGERLHILIFIDFSMLTDIARSDSGQAPAGA